MFSLSDVHRIFHEEMPEEWTETEASKMSGGKAYWSTQENRAYDTNEQDEWGLSIRFFVFATRHIGFNATTDEIIDIIQIKMMFMGHLIEDFIMDLNSLTPTQKEEAALRRHIKEMVGQFVS